MFQQSTLPDALATKTIKDLSDGDTGFVIPWAIAVDGQRKMWIGKDFTVEQKRAGTACVLIRKVSGGVLVNELTIGGERFEVKPEITDEYYYPVMLVCVV